MLDIVKKNKIREVDRMKEVFNQLIDLEKYN